VAVSKLARLQPGAVFAVRIFPCPRPIAANFTAPTVMRTPTSERSIMPRGNSQITTLYTNLVSSTAVLSDKTQARIFAYAKLTKDTVLAAALAKRSDTIDSIDKSLAKWDAAKVQAAWYARPGRSVEQIVAQLEREDRITVLEVLAGIDGLTPEVYAMCASKKVARIALPLIANPSASTDDKIQAARTLATLRDSLTYDRRAKLDELFKRMDDESIAAYVSATTDHRHAVEALADRTSINESTALHLCSLAAKLIKATCKEWKKPSPKQHSWEHAHFVQLGDQTLDLLLVLHRYGYLSVAQDAGMLPSTASVVEEIQSLHAALSKVKKQSNDEKSLCESIAAVLVTLGITVGTPSGDTLRLQHSTDPAEILEIAKRLERLDKLDQQCLLAAILNPNIDMTVAFFIGEKLRWGGVELEPLILSHKNSLSLHVLGTLMSVGWMQDDFYIEKFAGQYTTQEIWRANVIASLFESKVVPRYLLESNYAPGHGGSAVDSSFIGQLPFEVFAQTNLPSWIIDGMVDYLGTHLDTEEQWDGLEILAKSHVGTVEQLVRVVKLASKRPGKPATA